MATQDWPTDRAFAAATFQPGADVPKSTFRGFYTGNRETLSHLADRMTCVVTLPPCKSKTDAARREAFLMGLVSTGDWVRFGMPHRPRPQGTMSGSPTVNGAVAAGARSLVLSSVKSRPNTLLNSGFEIDTNADGVADDWIAYFGGSISGQAFTRVAGNGSTWAQRVFATSLGASTNDQVGVRRNFDPVTTGLTYTLAADVIANYITLNVRLFIGWYDGGGSLLSSSSAAAAGPAAWTRREFSATAPASATQCRCYVWMEGNGSVLSNAQIYVDNVQLEQSGAATSYSGFATAAPGDFIGIGGNLLQVAYAGATANDAGAMTVPLLYPVPEAISNGAAVTLESPTGTWELDTDGLQLDYTASNIQGGIALPFRQVIV